MIKNDRVGGVRNDDRHAGQGTAPPLITDLDGVNGQTAVEMTSPWKPKSGFHRDLEISQKARDSHIPTSRSSCMQRTRRTDSVVWGGPNSYTADA